MPTLRMRTSLRTGSSDDQLLSQLTTPNTSTKTHYSPRTTSPSNVSPCSRPAPAPLTSPYLTDQQHHLHHPSSHPLAPTATTVITITTTPIYPPPPSQLPTYQTSSPASMPSSAKTKPYVRATETTSISSGNSRRSNRRGTDRATKRTGGCRGAMRRGAGRGCSRRRQLLARTRDRRPKSPPRRLQFELAELMTPSLTMTIVPPPPV